MNNYTLETNYASKQGTLVKVRQRLNTGQSMLSHMDSEFQSVVDLGESKFFNQRMEQGKRKDSNDSFYSIDQDESDLRQFDNQNQEQTLNTQMSNNQYSINFLKQSTAKMNLPNTLVKSESERTQKSNPQQEMKDSILDPQFFDTVGNQEQFFSVNNDNNNYITTKQSQIITNKDLQQTNNNKQMFLSTSNNEQMFQSISNNNNPMFYPTNNSNPPIFMDNTQMFKSNYIQNEPQIIKQTASNDNAVNYFKEIYKDSSSFPSVNSKEESFYSANHLQISQNQNLVKTKIQHKNDNNQNNQQGLSITISKQDSQKNKIIQSQKQGIELQMLASKSKYHNFDKMDSNSLTEKLLSKEIVYNSFFQQDPPPPDQSFTFLRANPFSPQIQVQQTFYAPQKLSKPFRAGENRLIDYKNKQISQQLSKKIDKKQITLNTTALIHYNM